MEFAVVEQRARRKSAMALMTTAMVLSMINPIRQLHFAPMGRYVSWVNAVASCHRVVQ
jgi:hypothetical protein